jgi:DNA-binding beta-propeller fold protein YncE
MRRLLLILGLVTACGEVQQSTPDAAVPVMAIQVTGAMQLGLLASPAQLKAQATYSDGAMKDVTAEAAWSSVDTSIATVAAGLMTPLALGTATIKAELGGKAGTLSVAITAPTLAITNFSSNTIAFFPSTAAGNVAPARSIGGAMALLSGPRGLTIVGNELFVANQNGNSVSVFPADGMGNIAPIRQIIGAGTGLSAPADVTAFNSELYVGQLNGNVLVFPISATGAVAPTRTISFPGVGHCTGVKVFKSELYVADFVSTTAGQLVVAPVTANGVTAPTRTITGAATGFGGPQEIMIDGGQLFVANAYSNRVDVFDAATANGNLAPIRSITSAHYPYGMVMIGSELYVSNQSTSSVDVFPRTASGAAGPARQLTGATTTLQSNLGLAAF